MRDTAGDRLVLEQLIESRRLLREELAQLDGQIAQFRFILKNPKQKCHECKKIFWGAKKQGVPSYCSMSCRTSNYTRDAEIYRLHLNGESFASVAKKFDLSTPRVHQIFCQQERRIARSNRVT